MTSQSGPSADETASAPSYLLLSFAEYNERMAQLEASDHMSMRHRVPLVTTKGVSRALRCPAFQLDERLNHPLLLRLRELFKVQQADDDSVWDFLRTRHKHLGGLTGVDFLLGYFAPSVAAMDQGEREEHFLELALEDIHRLQQ